MIIRARLVNLTANTKPPKDEGQEAERHAKLVLELLDPEDWHLDWIQELMDGLPHEVAIDENMRGRS